MKHLSRSPAKPKKTPINTDSFDPVLGGKPLSGPDPSYRSTEASQEENAT